MLLDLNDFLMISAVFILSFQLSMNLLPHILKSEKFGDAVYVDFLIRELETMFIKINRKKAKTIIWGSSFALSLFLFLLFVFLNHIFAILIGVIGFVVGRLLPKIIVKQMKKRRVVRFNLQMVDALTLLSNALKAGLSITQGLENVSKQLPDPIAQEFNLILSEQQVGVSLEEAFINLGKRLDCEDVDMFVTAVVILRETGGNLSEVFDTIVNTIRERIKIQQKISALVSQGIMQGAIIFLMPFGLGIAFYMIDPNHIMPMLTTFVGNIFLLVMLVLQLIGGFVMLKIVKIEV